MEKLLQKLIGKKKYITKREYLICITSLLGYTPSNFEVSLLFHEKLLIPLEEFLKVMKYHNTVVDKELKVIEIFRLLDNEGKGFISSDDVYRVWKDNAAYLSWDYVSSCFRAISSDNSKIFYDSLRDMCLSMDDG